MIWTLIRIDWQGLRRDRAAQVLSLVLPVVFFSIFTLLFSGGGGDAEIRAVPVVVVDEDGSPESARLLAALQRDPGLAVSTADSDGKPYQSAALEGSIGRGELSVAVVIEKGFATSLVGGAPAAADGAGLAVLADTSDRVSPYVVSGRLQAALAAALPEVLVRQGVEAFARFAGPLAPEQAEALGKLPPEAGLREDGRPVVGAVPFTFTDVVGKKEKRPAVAYFAASTGVMFLLFMVSAVAGTLLDEATAGVLERLLTSNLGMGTLLLGKWLWTSILSICQVTLMFVWGALVFGLDLWTPRHLLGFTIMTVVTAVAAGGFGLVLATLCRSRAQLSAVSTIVVLLMSALGGSMVPRFQMPDWMQTVGLFTFNAWALDGYQKVFWYDRPLLELWPQVSVLLGLTALFLLIARRLARRWETV